MPTVDPENVTLLLASFVAFASPIVVEAFKRDTWKPAQTVLLGAVISILIYVGLHALRGTLTYPVTDEFLVGLFSTFGWQQTGYALLFKDRNRVVEVPTPTTTNIVTSSPVVVGDGDIKTGA